MLTSWLCYSGMSYAGMEYGQSRNFSPRNLYSILILFNFYKITQKSWGHCFLSFVQKGTEESGAPRAMNRSKKRSVGAGLPYCPLVFPFFGIRATTFSGSQHFLWCYRNTKALHTGPNVWGQPETAQDTLFAQHSGKLTGSRAQQRYSRCSLSMLHRKSCLHSGVYKWTIWNAPDAASTGSQVTKYSHLSVYDRHLVMAEPEFWGDRHWSDLRRKKGTSASLEWLIRHP